METKEQHILFILDRSGSMSPRATDVIGGFNTYISEMRQEAAKDGLRTVVSLVTFADNHSVVFGGKPIEEVPLLDEKTYRAMGSTALVDTVYDSVTKYRETVGQGCFVDRPPVDAPPVLVIVFTDGFENASKHATWEQVQELIKECEALGNWTFTYVGAHPGAWSQASMMHVSSGNTLDAHGICLRETTINLVAGSKKHREQYRLHDKKSLEGLFEEAEAQPSPGK